MQDKLQAKFAKTSFTSANNMKRTLLYPFIYTPTAPESSLTTYQRSPKHQGYTRFKDNSISIGSNKIFPRNEFCNIRINGFSNGNGNFTSLPEYIYLPNVSSISIWNQDISSFKITIDAPNLTRISMVNCNKMSDFELTGNLPKLAEINIKESNSFKNFKLNCSLPSLTKIDLEDSKRVTNLDCSIDSKEHPTPNLSVIYVGTNSSRNKIQSFGNFTKAPNLRYVSMPETNDIDYGFPSTVKLSN